MREVVTAAEWFGLACLFFVAVIWLVLALTERRRIRREWQWRLYELEDALAEEIQRREAAEAEVERLRGER